MSRLRPGRRRLNRAALALAVALVAIGAATATAARYSKPVILDEGGADYDNPQIAVEPSGRATVVWERPDSRHSSTSFIQAVRLDAKGRPIGEVQTLSERRSTSPQVAVDPSGASTVVWERDKTIEVVRLDTGGIPLGGARVISPEGERVHSPDVGVDNRGISTVAWDGNGVFAHRLAPDGGSLGEPVRLIDRGESRSPSVAVSAAGGATVAWRDDNSVHAARIDADGGQVGPEAELSPARSKSVGPPETGASAEGQTTVVWEGSGKGAAGILGAVVAPDGTASDPKLLSGPAKGSRFPHVAVSDGGRGLVAWQGWDPPDTRYPQGFAIYGIAVRRDGFDGRARKLAGNAQRFSKPRVATRSRGATVTWGYDDGSTTMVRVLDVGRDGEPGQAQTISAPGRAGYANAGSPVVGVDEDGRATVAWVRLNGKFFRIEASRER